MKKLIYLLFTWPLLLFLSCGDDNICKSNLYNYDGKSACIFIVVENETDEDFSISLNSYSFSDVYKLKQLKSDAESLKTKINSKSSSAITLPLIDNQVINLIPITNSAYNLHYQSIIGTITYSDSSTKKITGYDLDNLEISGMKKDDFDLSGFGYYKVDTAIKPVDKTFGIFISPDEKVNGIKEGTIILTIKVTDSGLEYFYQ